MRHFASIFGLLALAPGCYSGLPAAPNGTRDSGEAELDGGASGVATDGESGAEAGDAEEGGADSGDPRAECGAPSPGPSPVRRLTRREYNNTVRDLLGTSSRPADVFVSEEIALGFDNNANTLSVSQLLSEQYETAAHALAAEATEDPGASLGCDPAMGGDACVRTILETFLPRAYRRPVAEAELDRTFGFYAEQRAAADPNTALRLTLTATLMSPHFLYRVELDGEGGEVVAVDGYGRASRLSYFLWNSMPDAELFEAAAAGALDNAGGVAEQARRMLNDPRAADTLDDFHEQWLALRGNYPEPVKDVEALLREETVTFTREVVQNGDATLETLLTADFSFMNGELAAHYGAQVQAAGPEFARVELDPTRRAGLLTHASILALNAEGDSTHPIRRGEFIRERMLCQELPPPPPDLVVDPPQPDPNKTTRERFAQHRDDPACSSCHTLMDPVGFGFENYDHFGRFRSTENGFPVDARGELVAAADADGTFEGAVELAHQLAGSDIVHDCLVTEWFRYAHGRKETEDDECGREVLAQTFRDSGGDVRELLVAMTQTDAFLYRTSGDE